MPDRVARHPSAARLLAGQLRYHSRLFWRNPKAAFSTFLLPILLVVLVNALDGGRRGSAQLVTPGIAAFGVIAACYSNLATAVVAARDRGVLKRLRSTPRPAWAWFAGQLLATAAVALAGVVAMVAVGAALFGVRVPLHALPAIAVTLLLGAGCFAALGLAAAALIPNGAAAPALLGLTFFPLALASGVFSGGQPGPAWLGRLTAALPMQPFAAALRAGFDPSAAGAGLATRQLETLLGWAVLGLLVARRRFRWEPPGTAA